MLLSRGRSAIRSVCRSAVSVLVLGGTFSAVTWAQGDVAQRAANEPSLDWYRQQNLLAQSRLNGRLNRAFRQAAQEFDVPRDLLAALAYGETRFDETTAPDADGHVGDNGYGVMGLVQNAPGNPLRTAAKLLRIGEAVVKTSPEHNIRAAAALLRRHADKQGLNDTTRKNLAAWYPVVALYSNAQNDAVARVYADDVYNTLNKGVRGQSRRGETVSVLAREVRPDRGRYQDILVSPALDYSPDPPEVSVDSTDYGPALWVPANSGNYAASSRPTSYPIRYVVIHTVQGSYSSAINWFQNPAANVSAHYVVRSNDGQITQMVREKDYAYHAGNRTYNQQSIGIEHEGYVDNPAWYTDAMYRASAALTRAVCLKYNIPMDRAHIIGHNEVPGATHTDPGPNWNWTYYLQLVTQTPTWSAIVDNTTAGRFVASANWNTSSYSSLRYGADYRYADPQPVSDAAWFKFNLPATATYEVYVWYPSNAGYNASTPFVVATTGGNVYVSVNQQVSGGAWVSLGRFNLSAGDYNVVGVSRWTGTAGYVIADAVKIVQRSASLASVQPTQTAATSR